MNESKTVLVIDDDEDFLGLITDALKIDGYTVLQAENGQEGLEKALSEIPDLIVLDVMMPGMDGYQTCMKLQQSESTSHIPVLMLTAKTQTVDKFMGLFAGAVEYMCKPVKIQTFLESVRVLLTLGKGEAQEAEPDSE